MKKETIKMCVKLFLSILLGCLTFMWWTKHSHLTYDTVGSLDILSGAIIEFFMFTLLLEIYQNKQALDHKRELAKHLNEIEKLLRRNKNEH